MELIGDKYIKYFFDGKFWFTKEYQQLSHEQLEVMIKNTIEGQWLTNGSFEERTDVRTWVTEEKSI